MKMISARSVLIGAVVAISMGTISSATSFADTEKYVPCGGTPCDGNFQIPYWVPGDTPLEAVYGPSDVSAGGN